MKSRSSIDDPVGSHLLGVIVEYRHVSKCVCIDPYWLVMKIFGAETVKDIYHGRYHTGDNGICPRHGDVSQYLEKLPELTDIKDLDNETSISN